MRDSFDTREAARLAGFATAYMVDYLARTGIVAPSVRAAPGKGRRRLYSFHDVVLLTALNRLLERGLPVKGLKGLQDSYRRANEGRQPLDLAGRYLITDGARTLYADDTAPIAEFADEDGRGFALVIDLKPILAEILAALETGP